MKKSLMLGLLGLAISAAPSFSQGFVKLDNYNTSGPFITYGAGSGGTVGAPVGAGWTVGMYYGLGTLSFDDSTGFGIPSGAWMLAGGNGSTAELAGPTTGGTPGVFFSPALFQASANPGELISCVIVAFSGADYESSERRGHSSAFTMTTLAGNAVVPANVGEFMQSFSIVAVPEPSTFALMGLGSAALLIARRRKA